MADLTVKDTDPDPTGSVVALDADGNQTTFDDTPTVTSSDESIATASIDANGNLTVTKTGAVGATMITVSSTRSSDGQQLQGSATLTVEPSEEATIQVNLQAGTAQAAGTVDTSTVAGDTGTAPTATDPNAPAQ